MGPIFRAVPPRHRLPMRRLPVIVIVTAAGLLAGCDMLGIESATAIAARKEAEGKAVGAACRHSGRAIEDCYVMNKRADKAAVFAGWKEMNDYMRENNIESVAPTSVAAAPADKAAEGGGEKKTAKAGSGH